MKTFKEAFIDESIKSVMKRNSDSCVIELDGNTIGIFANDGKDKVQVQFPKDVFIKALEPLVASLFDINEGVSFSDTYSKMKNKIATADKGECDDIDKELNSLFKSKKLTGQEFDELSAAVGRKMEKE